jgi:hypothetical protein
VEDRCSCEIDCEVSLEKYRARVWPGFIWRRLGPSGLHASAGGGAVRLSRTTLLFGIGLSASSAWRLDLCYIGVTLYNESVRLRGKNEF